MLSDSCLRSICAALFVSSIPAFGQVTLGNITGRIIDPAGAAVAGAAVTASNMATGVNTSTVATETGDFNIQLYPGRYSLRVESAGFKRYMRENIQLTAASTVRVDPALELGSVSETVEVTGTALSVQSQDAKISTTVENRFVDELPLVVGGTMRSPFDLVSITPQAMVRGSADMALGGGQSRAWNATLDGISVGTNRSANQQEIAYNTPSLDAITEFTVDTGGFKAEYGQAGGGVVTFSSKSGTNQFHGSVYDFLRNEKLDARGFFANERSVYKQNDFGVTAGGPIRIPKIYDGRNRSFFFVAYEGFRNRVGANDFIGSVPTEEMYNGDFSNWVNRQGDLLQIYDPSTTRASAGGVFTRDPFPGNRIPASRFSPISARIIPIASVVKPNRGATPGTPGYVTQNFIASGGTVLEPQDKGSIKLDHNLTQDHRLSFFMNRVSYRREIGGAGPPGLPVPLWNGEVQQFETSSYRMSYDWIVSPRVLNHFQIGGNQFRKDSFSPNYGRNQNWSSRIGCFGNVIDCERNFPLITFTEFTGWGSNASNGTEQPLWSMKNDLSYSRGKHTLKFGFAFDSQRANGFGEQCIMGCANFSFLSTSVPGQTSFNSGSSFASFLLGDATGGGTETERYVTQLYRYYGFYAQDDWRVTSRLTLNLGLRYEFTLPPISLTDEYSDFTPNRPNPAVNNYPGALRFAGFGPGRENTRALTPGWYGGFGPRIGLAYAVNSKTSLRTAFGRSFSRVTAVSGSGHYAGFIGNYRFSSLDQGITPAFNWDAGLPSYPLPVGLDPNATLDPAFANNQNVTYWQLSDAVRAPENYYWTFNIQRELTSNTVLEIGYSANIGAHLQTGLVNLNQVPTAIWNDYVAKLGPAGAQNLLRADINSAIARANNVPIPYGNFTDPDVQQVRSVNQALRPFPQYLQIQTGGHGGDKSGHSTYHALLLKATRRFSNGLAFEWNYVLSKLLTDADNYSEGDGGTQDQYNRRLEKSIGEFDQTHVAKFSTVYELPFGRGRKWLSGSHAVVNGLLGGWRIGAIQMYASGFPIALARNNPLPIFNRSTRPTIASYDNWRGPESAGGFDPATDRFLDRSVFPAQPTNFGNATRHNPNVRTFPAFNENISLAKSFPMTESVRLDFRVEAFNLFNRVQFGTGSTNLNSNNFGIVTDQANEPRRMQIGIKLYW
jgi:hypothetical protein